MVTRKQIAVLEKPFLDRHQDVVRVDSRLIQVPFTHFVKGLCISRTSRVHEVQPMHFIWLLCDGPVTSIPLDNGGSFGPYVGYLDVSGEGAAETLMRLMEGVWERLSRVRDLHDLQAYLANPEMVLPGSLINRWLLPAALGQFDVAFQKMQGLLRNEANSAKQGNEKEDDKVRRLRHVELARRLREAPPTVYALLHEWEAENVRALGLENYWQPAPFPFETT